MIKKSSVFTVYMIKQCKLMKIKRNIIKDVRTRWNSSYFMIDSLIKLRPVIEQLFNDKHHLHIKNEQIESLSSLEISTTEWNYLIQSNNLLEIFHHATKTMSGCSYPSIGLAYFVLIKLKSFLINNKNDNSVIKRMKKSLATQYFHYFEENGSQLKTLKVSNKKN